MISRSRLPAVVVACAGAAAFLAAIPLPRVVASVEWRRRAERQRAVADWSSDPSIDVVIPSYLESGVIGKKIDDVRNALNAARRQGRIIVVASDSETAGASAGADLVVTTARLGKASACNTGLSHATSDIVVFTDANCEIQPLDWPAVITRELAEWNLVSAHKRERGGSEQAFWQLERWTKRQSESRLGTLSVAGEFLAARRDDMRAIRTPAVLDDLMIARSFHDRGLSVTTSTEITTIEEGISGTEQWHRRVRIAEGLFVEAFPHLFTLVRTPIGRIFVAHKLYRVSIGCLGFWCGFLATCLLLSPWSAVVVVAAAYLTAAYRYDLPLPRLARVASTVFGLQAVPIAAIARIVRRRLAREPSVEASLWEKVER